ncbi:MAG: hypothetical protein KBF93_05640 [Leptospiraceae bacterium]|nr:hypothetical protein [Leptospiraceae bacterium]
MDTDKGKTILFNPCSSVFIRGILITFSLSLFPQDVVNTVRPHFIDKVDVFGRNYRLKWNGEIQFSLDDSYKEAIPDLEQLDVHIAEAKELVAKRKFFPAIRLLKGISLCQKIDSKNKKQIKPEIQTILNKLISQNQDKKDELEILTEPYGCYAESAKKEKKLFIESKDFSFLYEIDYRFRYVFPNDLYRFARKEKEYNWKVSYFRILLNKLENEKTLESEYIKYEKKIFYESPSQIIFSIGQTSHNHNLTDTSHYPDLWDSRRGLSNSVKRSSNFTRKEIFTGVYETSFNLADESKIRSYTGFETYKYANSKGLAVFLTCPSEFQDECKSIWQEMK